MLLLMLSSETRLERRKYRDETVRGYIPDEVEYQWNNHVRPADKFTLNLGRKSAMLLSIMKMIILKV